MGAGKKMAAQQSDGESWDVAETLRRSSSRGSFGIAQCGLSFSTRLMGRATDKYIRSVIIGLDFKLSKACSYDINALHFNLIYKDIMVSKIDRNITAIV